MCCTDQFGHGAHPVPVAPSSQIGEHLCRGRRIGEGRRAHLYRRRPCQQELDDVLGGGDPAHADDRQRRMGLVGVEDRSNCDRPDRRSRQAAAPGTQEWPTCFDVYHHAEEGVRHCDGLGTRSGSGSGYIRQFGGVGAELGPPGTAGRCRSVDDLDRPQLVVCSVADTREEALDGARLMVTQYLGQQPHIMKASGVPESLLEEVGKILTWPATHEQVEAASRLVPDDIVQMICAAGTPDEVREKVGQYMADGCTCPILYPLGPDVHMMVDVFADWTP